MKENIHPAYHTIKVTCGCGNQFETGSTLEKDELYVEVCAACHPFYTGKQKIVDTAGRIERMKRKYNLGGAAAAKESPEKKQKS